MVLTRLLALRWSALLALGSPVAVQQVQVAPPPPSIAVDVARLQGEVSALSNQLESQRAMAESVLSAIQTILTVYTAAGAAIVVLLGFLGYTNLKGFMEREVERRVEASLVETVDEKLRGHLLQWDAKFEQLFQRIERLADRER